jgi:tetratricopeptide (TPR) repeat protein
MFLDKDDIISILLKINYSLIDRRQFLNICLKEYEGNSNEIENLEDFEHLYLSSNALKYFFKETFLYRLLIKSLQIFNIDMLFLLRFFLQDIEQQLKSCPTISIPVYRGQLMTNNQIEFLQNSIKKNFLRFNSFIIAKTNREQVLKSLRNSTNKYNFNLVLFHIEMNQIGKQFEEFILFPITTQFQIISIDYQNNIYIIQIILSNSNSYLNQNRTTPIELAHRLKNLGRFDQAEKIFHRLLSQYPTKTSQLYNELAQIAQDKGLYEISLQFYEKSLVKVSSKDRPYCLNNIGCMYDYLEQYHLALQFYSTALTLMKNDIDRAMCINNIGITLANQQHYQDALQSFQQSLFIRQKFLAENHSDLGISHANIGVLYSSINQSDLALQHYQKALKIFSRNCSPIYKAIVYQNLGQIFFDKNQLKEALNYYQQAATIFRKTRPSNHPTLIYIEKIINLLT